MQAALAKFVVERTLSPDVVAGVASGLYKIHGGVIRWAAGTPMAGQIVRHLIPVAAASTGAPVAAIVGIGGTALQAFNYARLGAVRRDLSAVGQQVSALQEITSQVFSMGKATMQLSGLNLSAVAFGFMAMTHRLGAIDEQLKQIADDVKEIKRMLEHAQHAEMTHALKELSKANSSDGQNRQTVLHSSRGSLGKLVDLYGQRLAEVDKPSEMKQASLYEDLYTVCALAQARCSAELGMFEIARAEVEEASRTWHLHARRFARDLCLRGKAVRFMDPAYKDELPLAVLPVWMDFAHDSEKGLEHLDELRGEQAGFLKWWETLQLNPFSSEQEEDVKLVIPLMHRIVARSDVYGGYEAQYKLLEQSRLTPSEFEREAKRLAESEGIEDLLILRPEQQN